MAAAAAVGGVLGIRDVATADLLAELAKRHGAGARISEKPECSSGDRGTYDTPLHVFALFLILALSTLCCAIPLLTTRRASRRSSTVIFACQHFGTGVLIATAFVHLLPTAFESLTDPCLPDAFNVGYRPLPGLVAMASALAVVWIEQYLATRGAGHAHAHHHHHEWEELDGEEGYNDDERRDGGGELMRGRQDGGGGGGGGGGGIGGRGGGLAARRDIALEDLETAALVGDVTPLPGMSPLRMTDKPLDKSGNNNHKTHNNNDDVGIDLGSDSDSDSDSDLDLALDELDPPPGPMTTTTTNNNNHAKRSTISPPLTPTTLSAEERHRLVLQCLLLEAGILFHSIFIGMALSVATGPTFVVFLVAISFHQAFEGLALGSRIAALHYPRASPRPWLMVLAYGATTPLGQALGLAMHNMYDPRSVAGLLVVGLMNAVSAGLLLFAGLVQLLAEDFLSEKSYRTLRGARRAWAFGAVVAGAGLMALVGAFA